VENHKKMYQASRYVGLDFNLGSPKTKEKSYEMKVAILIKQIITFPTFLQLRDLLLVVQQQE
jgi:hypothetical protein